MALYSETESRKSALPFDADPRLHPLAAYSVYQVRQAIYLNLRKLIRRPIGFPGDLTSGFGHLVPLHLLPPRGNFLHQEHRPLIVKLF